MNNVKTLGEGANDHTKELSSQGQHTGFLSGPCVCRSTLVDPLNCEFPESDKESCMFLAVV